MVSACVIFFFFFFFFFFDFKITLNLVSCIEKLRFCHYVCNFVMDVIS